MKITNSDIFQAVPGIKEPNRKHEKKDALVEKIATHSINETIQNNPTLDVKKVEVWMPAFSTLAIDPSFTEDGKYLQIGSYAENLIKTDSNVKIEPSFLNFSHWIKQIINYIKRNLNKDSRIDACFQDLKKIEREWNLVAKSIGITYDPGNPPAMSINTTYVPKGVVWQTKAFYVLQLLENKFYEKLSEIESLGREKNGGKQKFSSELFLPVHRLYAPQNEDWHIEKILQEGEGQENLDLARLGKFGYQRLSSHYKKTDSYVAHTSFASDIKDKADSLIVSIRKLRLALREEKDLSEYKEILKEFKACWNAYINSNSLLQELSVVYSKDSPFKDLYVFLEKSKQNILQPKFDDQEIFQKFQIPMDRYLNIGFQNLVKIFNKTFPNSPTGQLLKL